MPLNVKNKIRLGTLFLFLLLLLTGGIGIYFMVKLKAEAKAVLKDNYESLSYCHTMQQQLNKLETDYQQSIRKFEEALQKQQDNITEKGEGKATADLKMYFNKIKSGDTTKQNMQFIQNKIQYILTLNMNALGNKNTKAQETADKALTIIIALAGIVFLISFTFVVNFPSVVTNPINRLTEAIMEIGNKNYNYRIHLNRKDEFGKLADAFNDMAERLSYFESSNLNKLMFEKTRAEAVINSLKDASIGIDKNNNVLFANQQALQLLELNSNEVVGKPVSDISGRNDLFRFLIDNEVSMPFKIVVENKENYFVKEVIEVAQSDANNKVIVLKNITSFKELDAAKTNFIATISHELKTPLASSDFSLKLLEDERVSKLSAEQKRVDSKSERRQSTDA
ncbi:MAG: HAMP domain-containing protein [Segetibacter sp.]